MKADNINTPAEVIELAEGMGQEVQPTLPKLILLDYGRYLSPWGRPSLLMGYGIPELAETAPAAKANFLAGLLLPYRFDAYYIGRWRTLYWKYRISNDFMQVSPWSCPWKYLLYNWTVVYLPTFVGALIFSYFFIHLTGMMTTPYDSAIIKIGLGKAAMPWHVVFSKVSANSYGLYCCVARLGAPKICQVGSSGYGSCNGVCGYG